MCSEVEEWLRWFAHPSDAVEYQGHAQDPAFAPQTPEVSVGFLVFLYPLSIM